MPLDSKGLLEGLSAIKDTKFECVKVTICVDGQFYPIKDINLIDSFIKGRQIILEVEE